MPKGTATGDLDEYRPIALGQQDMRMLMTPLMRRFTAVPARKGLAANWLGVYREPLDGLGQLRNKGSRDPIGPRRLVVRHRLLHVVLEVLWFLVLYRPPFIWNTPEGYGP